MNREDLFDAVTEVDESHLRLADARHERKKNLTFRRWRRVAVAAILVIAVLGGTVIRSFTSNGGVMVPKAYAVALAEYPRMADFPKKDNGAAYESWRSDIRKQSRPAGHADGLGEFFTATMGEFLSDTQGENKLFSPVNVYLALGMLAELTDGESRAQILDLLGYEDMESLRKQAGDIWNANYMNDGKTVSILGSSLWLNENIPFEKGVLNRLAETYYASTYQGTMGSEKFDQALRDWLDAQTGGKLGESTKNIKLKADTILALASTIYYQAKWDSRFSAEKNTEDLFHAPDGDVTVEYMNSPGMEGTYYWGEHFGAVAVPLENAGAMWFILPDEGVTAEELLEDAEAMALICQENDWENRQKCRINLSVPKFDVTGGTDLIDGLKNLGVTDVFDFTTADFTPLLGDGNGGHQPYVNQAQHDVRVAIDEDGVTAVAYTLIVTKVGAAPGSPDEVDFVVDRPFLFLITGADDVPLFSGIVNRP